MAMTEQRPIYSTLSEDPEVAELVGEFVDALPRRMGDIVEALGANDLSSIRRLAHQLKGAGGGYGFHEIGEAAGEVEASSKTALSVAELTRHVQSLVNLCKRACKGPPP